MAGTYLKDIISIIPCNVDSVDQNNRVCDCTPIGGDAATQIPSVQLCAENDNGLLVFPEVGSTVIVGFSTRNLAFVMLYSGVSNMQMLDGSFGGLVKVIELTIKINNLENLVNNILNVLKSTSIPLAPSGTYPFAPLYTALSDITPLTQRNDIENNLILHGK